MAPTNSGETQNPSLPTLTTTTSDHLNSCTRSPSTMAASTSKHTDGPITPTIAQNSLLPLMKLPPELRNNIYNYYFSDLETRFRASRPAEMVLRRYLSLLHSSRQVRNETVSMFYKEYMSKTKSGRLPFWRITSTEAPRMIRRLKAFAKSLAENDANVRVDVVLVEESENVQSTLQFMEALVGHIQSRGPPQKRKSLIADQKASMLLLRNEQEACVREHERRMASNNYEDRCYYWRGKIGRFQITYSNCCFERSWREPGLEDGYHESFRLTGPIAKIDWSDFEYDWGDRYRHLR